MAPSKPTAQEIKKRVLALHGMLPPDAAIGRVLTAVANHEAVVRMLAQAHPGADEALLRRSLAATASLLDEMKTWAAPAEEKTTPATADEPEWSPEADDATVLRNHSRVKVHVDGASKGNPGPASAGIVVTDVEGALLFETGIYLGDRLTNNAAEYGGLIHALRILVANGCPEAYFFADSMLMVNQMNLTWRVKHPAMKPLFTEAQKLKRQLPRFQIVHVAREKNARADKLANLAIKQKRAASSM